MTTNEDKSRKSSIDADIVDLIDFLNARPEFETTSSCSGRIVAYQRSPEGKRNCRWLLTSHSVIAPENLLASLQDLLPGRANVKFEPFILHCRCANLEAAKKLMAAAVSSGYRESGISVGKKKKILVAVRSSQNMDVPLADAEGRMIATEEYILFLSRILNEKMEENASRRDRFFAAVKAAFSSGDCSHE